MRLVKKIALALSLLMFSAVILSACNGTGDNDPAVVASIDFKAGTYKTEYEFGEQLNFSQVKLVLTYDDDTTSEVGFGSFGLNGHEINTSRAGTYILKATYVDANNDNKEFVCQRTVEVVDNRPVVVPAKVTSIAFHGTVKTEFKLNEQLHLFVNALKILVTYDNETTEILNFGSFSVNTDEIDMTTPNNYTLTVTYRDPNDDNKPYTVSKTITVLPEEITPEEILEVTDFKLNTFGLKATYNTTETIDFAGLTAVLTYDDDSALTISYGAFSVNTSELTMNIEGDYTLIATYIDTDNENKTFTDEWDFKVIDPNSLIMNYEMPQSFVDFEHKRSVENEERSRFKQNENDYKVGTMNAFKFFPEIKKLDSNDNQIIVSEYASITKVYIYDGETPVLLTDETYVEVDEARGLFNFKSSAEGKKFKITLQVQPDDVYIPALKTRVLTLDNIKVIDGYNIYTAEELSLLDNTERTGAVDRWAEFKTSRGLPLASDTQGSAFAINNLILHNDLVLKLSKTNTDQNNLSTNFLDYHASVQGDALIDYKHLYVRDTREGESFTFYGNYFTIDSSNLPLVIRDNSPVANAEYITANTALFDFGHGLGDTKRGSNTVRDLNMIGNASRSNEAKYIGGHFALQAECDSFTAENVIARSYHTVFQAIGSNANDLTYTVRDSRSYDSFSQMTFIWLADMVVENSELIDAGGPIFSMTDVDTGNRRSTVSADSDTVAESWLNGDEVWFARGGATPLVTQIKPVNNLFLALNRSMVRKEVKELINFVAVSMSQSINDSFTIENQLTLNEKNPVAGQSDITTTFTSTDAIAGQMRAGIVTAGGSSPESYMAPIFKTSVGGYSVYLGEQDFSAAGGTANTNAILFPTFLPSNVPSAPPFLPSHLWGAFDYFAGIDGYATIKGTADTNKAAALMGNYMTVYVGNMFITVKCWDV